jgi:hypothetical protein
MVKDRVVAAVVLSVAAVQVVVAVAVALSVVLAAATIIHSSAVAKSVSTRGVRVAALTAVARANPVS